MSIPAGTDQVTACGAALIEHGSARYSWNERPEDIYVLRAIRVEPRIKVYSSLADLLMICRGLFVLCAGGNLFPPGNILVRMNRQTKEFRKESEHYEDYFKRWFCNRVCRGKICD